MQKEYIERKQALEILEKSLTFSEIELDKGDFRKGCIAAIQDDISNIRHIPTADVVPRAEVERLEKEIKALLAFKDYFSDLYGHGLEIANWHENGELEYFDMFYESAVDEYEAELKKKYTEGEE